MSKIQDALQKFQSGRETPARNAVVKAPQEPKIFVESGSPASHGVVIEFDREALREAGLMASAANEKEIANQYRDIKRPLIASALGKRVAKVDDGNLIMVTSAISGEGKTFTSFNLAFSIAREQDLSVLLVDADVAKPHISDILGVGEMPGLLDILDGTQDSLASVIVPTNIDNLSVLPAGAPRPHAAELLSGSRMESVVRQLVDQNPHRFIVFDTPPILQSSESRALLNITGQVVLVVKSESTTQGTVARALQNLGEQLPVNLVLNQYKGGGGHQYSYGYDASAPTAEPVITTASSEASQGSTFNS